MTKHAQGRDGSPSRPIPVINRSDLVEHFDRLIDTPDAVPRLRRFILDLAVRGKLVEQDPKDEPAGELLTRIAKGKARLAKAVTVRRPISHLLTEDVVNPFEGPELKVPFQLPSTWEWARFAEVASIESDLVKPERFLDLPHIAPDNIEGGTGRLLSYQTIRESNVISAKHRFFPGQIIYSKIRPNLAKAALVDFEGLCSADMYPIRPQIHRAFLLMFMLSEAFIHQSIAEANRVAMPKINQESLSKILVIVPPLAEQQRIVAKVDDLMSLCGDLEVAQTKREKRRDRLVAATLHGLNNDDTTPTPGTPSAFEKNARFYFNHLSRLTTRPEHIHQLRHTILNLAVRGKLVRQDASEESASELMRKIAAKKAQLETQGKYRGDTSVRAMSHSDRPFALPSSWTWVRFGDIVFSRDGERIPVSKEERSLRAKVYDYYGASGVIDKIDSFLFDKPLLLIGEDGANLINRSTPIAFMAWGKYWVNNHAHVLDGISEGFLRFLELHINAIDLKPYVTGTAQPKMNQAKMNSIPIALPPESEQRRIVAKVDELMSQCDELETGLSRNASTRGQFLGAALNHALSAGA